MVAQLIGTAAGSAAPFPKPCAAHRLGPAERKGLSVQVLAGQVSVTDLSRQHGVSRKFVYQQADAADQALEEAFAGPDGQERVLFCLPVTKKWIGSFVLAQALEGHSSYRGITRIAGDLLRVDLSIGGVHNILKRAADQARIVNAAEDLSAVRVGAHDEIYQANRPVLVGRDLDSLYCYLLAEAEHCDETTWGLHLLDLSEKQGLRPDYTIADGGLALRAGQRAAWGAAVPCHGDVFHAERDLGAVASFLEHRAAGCRLARQKLERKMEQAKRRGQGHRWSRKLVVAQEAEAQAATLALDIRTLAEWLEKDILSAAGPSLAIRRELFDFVVEELFRREPLCPHRIEPVRVALQKQRDDLLAFAGQMEEEFTVLATQFQVAPRRVQEVCELEGVDQNTAAYWQRQGHLQRELAGRFEPLRAAVRQVIDHTPRASSLVENLNSVLRNYFFLRRELGDGFLELLRFFLNHRPFLRSERLQRVGKSPAQLLTGRPHAHWLELLGFEPFSRN
jgi:hypothetical protein